jgi:hypothetical protein
MNSATKIRLDHAELLLAGPDFTAVWPRCACWLLRLAVEHALRQFWCSRRPEVADCSWRSQLLALRKFTDADTQHRVCDLWNTLSRAGHHHQYELAPTETELRRWLNEARLLAVQLEDQP